MRDIVRCGSLFRDHDGTARRCEVITGHIGSHQNFGLKIPRKCNAQHGSWGCVMRAGHRGLHSDDVDEWGPSWPSSFTQPQDPCGVLITWCGTGSDTCALRAGHRGLHSSGPGDYIGGRTTEDVLVEAFQRISELEARLSEIDRTTNRLQAQAESADTTSGVTEDSVGRALGFLERRITDRLSGLESLIRDVSAKVSQLHVTGRD